MNEDEVDHAKSAKTSYLVTYVKLTLVACSWGGTFVAGRSLAQLGLPLHIAAFRFFLASIALIAFSVMKYGRVRKPSSRVIAASAVLGFFGAFIYNIFFFQALVTLTAGRAALMISLSPLFTSGIAAVCLREKFFRVQIIGIITALFGVTVVLSHGDLRAIFSSFHAGEYAMVIAVLGWSLYGVLGRVFLEQMPQTSPFEFTMYSCIAGCVLLFCTTLSSLGNFSIILTHFSYIGPIAYLGFIATALSFVWYSEGIAHIGASRSAIFSNLVPVTGILLGALLLGESLDLAVIIGGILIVIGIVLTNRSNQALECHIRCGIDTATGP